MRLNHKAEVQDCMNATLQDCVDARGGSSDTFFAQANQRGAIGSNSLDSMAGVILAI